MLVRCVNCGAGGPAWPTIVALVFGGFGALVAARGLWIQTTEQRRLATELAKRADLAITVTPRGSHYTRVDSDSANLSTSSDSVVIYLEIGLTNTGQRASNHTVLNVLVPQRFGSFRWTNPNGAPLERGLRTVPTSEDVGDTVGEGSWWISDEVERVALRTPRLRFVSLLADMPADADRIEVRVRVKAQSDDLPDDVVERVKEFTVIVSRTERGLIDDGLALPPVA
jgi:hypothetical protein